MRSAACGLKEGAGRMVAVCTVYYDCVRLIRSKEAKERDEERKRAAEDRKERATEETPAYARDTRERRG